MPRSSPSKSKSPSPVSSPSGPGYYLRSSDSAQRTPPSEKSRSKSKSKSPVNSPQSRAHAKELREDRQNIVIWKRPFQTIRYCIMELFCLVIDAFYRLLPYWPQLLIIGTIFVLSASTYHYLEFADHYFFVYLRKRIAWCAYWIFLGVLSSVGLGTGLHTFVLYLGPHIARVTLAAYECQTVHFPEPPYPDDVLCPEAVGSHEREDVSIWLIMSKVRLEAVMWGLGTAIGELPPYFVARAARLSGQQSDDDEDNKTEEELRELEALLASKPEELGLADRIKLKIHWLIQRVGFWGILACASIPNPLFDLAGITCGHFLVPFATFFGATAIGKAIIKMHIQQLFVIFLFSQHHVEHLISLIGKLPGGIGQKIELPFKEYLDNQRTHLHTGGERSGGDHSMLGAVFGGLVTLMLAYFAVSIVNSLAQSYHARISKQQQRSVKNS